MQLCEMMWAMYQDILFFYVVFIQISSYSGLGKNVWFERTYFFKCGRFGLIMPPGEDYSVSKVHKECIETSSIMFFFLYIYNHVLL